METERTQGPWQAKALATYQEPGHVILWPDKGGTHMRRLDYQGNFTGPDARLIAAAPDLLAALQEVVTISDRKHDAWDAAKAAIAKATGQ